MIQPSLQIGGGDWAVKETKLLGTNPVLNRKLPVEIDVTNATVGTRVNQDGIIENGPRNLITYSEDFSNWIGNVNVISNTQIDPKNKKLADTFKTEFPGEALYQNVSVKGLTQHTFSLYVKLGTMLQSEYKIAIYDVSNSSFIAVNVTPTQVVSSFAWTRVSYSFLTPVGCNTLRPFAFRNSSTVVGTVFLWGAQLEEGSVATEYYPTTTRTNLARIDYSSGEAALLIEPQKTNIALYSQEFDNAYWLKVRASITPNVIISPDGSLTADKLVEDTSNNNHYLWKFIGTVSNGDIRAVSVYVKKAERSVVTLQCLGVSGFQATFNLDTQTISNSSGLYGGNSPSSTTIIALANGWFRISISGVFNVSNNNSTLVTNILLSNGASETYLGDGTSGLHIWGAQIEVSSYATSYIPTLASAVTRNVDALIKRNIYTEGLITNAGGTWFVELINNTEKLRDSLGFGISLSTTDSTAPTAGFCIRHSSSATNARLQVLVNYVQIGYQTLTDRVKIIYKWDGQVANVFVNGIKRIVNYQFTTTQIEFLRADNQDVDKNIKSMLLFPIPLTDAECIELTTL